MKLPDIPDPPPNHRLRTLTFLATGFALVASIGADSYRDGPVGRREHVFTHVRARAAPLRAPGASAARASACERLQLRRV